MRRVWVRRGAGDDENLAWAPAAVSSDDAESGALRVQLESWEDLNKGARKRADGSDSDSDSEPGGEVDEDAILEVKEEDVLDRNEWESPPQDLVQLVHLHEPAILQALCERFWDSEIYTWCGPILLALNPFERLPLYRKSILERFRTRPDGQERASETNEPHVYAVAADAFAFLVDKSGRETADKNQSILISGESGAGKTESTKIVMQYLATVARRPREDGSEVQEALHVSEYLGDEDDEGSSSSSSSSAGKVGAGAGAAEEDVTKYSIEQQVLESNPILEAFGNARTIRNDNSSRFGKFIQIQFDEHGFLVGATISSYLLEKVRIIHQGENERGYHVFYQMLSGGSEDEKAAWQLDPDDEPADFDFLNQGGCYERRDGVSDAAQLSVTKRAMRIMGISDAEREAVLSLVAAVLHLGNVAFAEHTGSDPGEKAGSTVDLETPSSKRSFEAVTALLGLDADLTVKALCSRKVNAGGETFEVPLAPQDAADTRDALAKSMYSRAFDWLVSRVNECIRAKGKARRFIGVLDIFGFEIFQDNSFEQLCINYANERLQQQFNDFVFQHEQQVYAKEKISWSFIDFPSNATTVQLIDASAAAGGTGMGILALLDDECRLPKGNDEGFVRKLYESCGERDRFSASKAQRVRGEFVVEHYAGAVAYNSEGFCEKNRDALRQEAVDLMTSASHAFVSALFKEQGASADKKSKRVSRTASADKQRRSALSLSSVGAEFKKQLTSLIETIEDTVPHYIRCIKPNDVARAKHIHRPRVVAQLRCGGVLEAVRVARAGFPIRMPHKTFIQRYGRLGGPAALKAVFDASRAGDAGVRKAGRAILGQLAAAGDLDRSQSRALSREVVDLLSGLHSGDDMTTLVQIGKTKVFLRKQGHDLFERWVARWTRTAAATVMAYFRGFAVRQHFVRARSAAVRVQAAARARLARARTAALRAARATLALQTWWRMAAARRDLRAARSAAIVLQSAERGRTDRAEARARRIVRARLRLQAFARAAPHRRAFAKQRRSAITIQCAARSRAARHAVAEAKRTARDLTHVLEERNRLRDELVALRAQLKQQGGGGGVVAEGPTTKEAAVEPGPSAAAAAAAHPVDAGTLLRDPKVRERARFLSAAGLALARLWQGLVAHRPPTEAGGSGGVEPAPVEPPAPIEPSTMASEPATQEDEAPRTPTRASKVDALHQVLSSGGQNGDDEGGAGARAPAMDGDWYQATFGKELEELDQVAARGSPARNSEAGGDGAGDAAAAAAASAAEDLEEIEKEMQSKRASIEAQRAELHRLQAQLKDEEAATTAARSAVGESGNAQVMQMMRDSLEAAEAEGRERTAAAEAARSEAEAAVAKLEAELASKSDYIGQLTSLKNQAEIKQGEMELSLSAAKGQVAELESKVAELEKRREEAETELRIAKNDMDSNRHMAKSAAVLQLENELRAAQVQADNAALAQKQAQAELELAARERAVQESAAEEYRKSVGAKMALLERDLALVQRAKSKSESILQARVVIDRRSRRVAQNVVSVWSAWTRHKQQLRVRLDCARRARDSRRLALALRAWSDLTKQAQRAESLLERHLERKRGDLLRTTFRQWAAAVNRDYHVSALAQALAKRGSRATLHRVLHTWRGWAHLRAEERLLFEQLTRVFQVNVLRRLFSAWRAWVRKSARLDVLEEAHAAIRRQRALGKVFNRWARLSACKAPSGEATPGSPGSPEPNNEANLELVATLMKRMEMQNAKMEELLKQRDARDARAAQEQIHRSDLFFSNGEAGGPHIEQLGSDDELEVEDSFYGVPSTPLAVTKSAYVRRTKSERLTYETPTHGRSGGRVDPNGLDVFRSGGGGSMRTIGGGGGFLERSPAGDALLEDGTPLPSRRGGSRALLGAAELARANSTPQLFAPDSPKSTDMVLGAVGVGAVSQDGTLAFDETEGAEPKADVETVLRTAQTINIPPVVLAAQHGLCDVLWQLLEQGADPNVEDHRRHRTALHAAIQAHQWSGDGSERMVEMLLERGANVHARNNSGNTPLMEAALKGDGALALTRALLRHGALSDPKEESANEFGQTPLHAAIRLGAVQTIHLLLKNGASLVKGDSQGQTAIHHAARLCSLPAMENILGFKSMRAGAGEESVKDLQDINGNTALHLVCSSTSPDLAKAIYVLLENDFDPNVKNRAGQTPLHILAANNRCTRDALRRYYTPAVRFHEQDRNGNTPLHVACHLNIREIACELVRLGAAVFIPNRDRATPLNLVPQAFAVKLLRALQAPPDEQLAKRFQRHIDRCTICAKGFKMFLDQHYCRHCGRVCCARCSTNKFPILKFGIDKSVTLCDHCFLALTLHARSGSMDGSEASLSPQRVGTP